MEKQPEEMNSDIVKMLKDYRAKLSDKRMEFCEPPHWCAVDEEWDKKTTFKMPYSRAVKYVEQVEEFAKMIRTTLTEYEDLLKKCDHILSKHEEKPVAEEKPVEKRKEPEPPVVSVVETPVAKKPAAVVAGKR